MKTIKKVWAVIFIFSLLIISGCSNELETLTIEKIDFKQVKDGEYIGETNLGYPPMKAKVEVTVEGGVVRDIKILEHEFATYNNSEQILENIKEKQSLEVDVIAGATGSSKLLLKSIENALIKGLME